MKFVFDLDGTIVFNQMPVAGKLLNMLYELLRQGHQIVFATARSIRGIKAVIPAMLAHNSCLICCNGALCLEKDKIIYERYIQLKAVKTLIYSDILNEVPFLIEMGDAYYHPLIQHPYFDRLKKEAEFERLETLDLVSNKKIFKLSILKPNQQILDVISQYDSLRIVIHCDGNIDLVHADVNKWACFQQCVLDPTSDRREIIFFGNDMNDYEMFKNLKNENCFLIGNHPALLPHVKHSISYSNPEEAIDGVLSRIERCIMESLFN